jgi:NitT/TauT family transport system substrate-binding protein
VGKDRRVDRRTFLKATAGAALVPSVAALLPAPAIAAQRSVKYTLAWLAQGSSLHTYVGRNKGFFKARGIDLEISRGFGSLAAAQTIAGGQFDFGMVLATPLILSIAKGLPLTAVATIDYDATMGVGVLADSPIKSPLDLAGKKVGAVPTSAEYPFFPAYAKKVGLDMKSVELVHLDNKVLERALAEKQVDAIMGVGSSSLPVLMSQAVPVRWMLYSSAGIRTYGQTLVTQPSLLEKDPGLCEAMVDGMMEACAFCLRNPDEAMDIFFKEVPEILLNANGKEFSRIGLGMFHYTQAQPEAREHGLGWGDEKIYAEMTDLVMTYLAEPGMKRPEAAQEFTNRFAGKFSLAPPQWSAVATRVSEFGRLLS